MLISDRIHLLQTEWHVGDIRRNVAQASDSAHKLVHFQGNQFNWILVDPLVEDGLCRRATRDAGGGV